MLTGWPAALQGAPATERSLFQYKSLLTPHFATKKKNFGQFLGKFSLSLSLSLSLSHFSPKHNQTHQNAFKQFRFSSFLYKILIFSLQSSRQCSCTQSSSPWFHTLDLRFKGVDVAFQLQSTHPSLYYFSQLYLLNKMLLLFFLACSCFLACFYRSYSMFPCLCPDLLF